MTRPNEGTPRPTDYDPDFTLPRRDAIREDNWQEYAARGFIPVPEPLGLAEVFYGVANVYTGDEYDYVEGRPLSHKPGVGAYISQAGMDHFQARLRDERWFRTLYQDIQAATDHAEPGSN